jgi:hypothetical protein
VQSLPENVGMLDVGNYHFEAHRRGFEGFLEILSKGKLVIV